MNDQVPSQINRIFCAFPIFCPSEKMFQRNMASVVSFVEYVKANQHLLDGSKGTLLDCYWGGWASKDEWYNEISKYIKENLPVVNDNIVKVFRFDKNYGKSKIVNDLTFEYVMDKPDTQFMFTMDSDIKFMNSEIHFFDRLMLAARCLEEVNFKASGVKKSFGMIALNQTESCYHWFEAKPGYKGMDQNATYDIGGPDFNVKEQIVWPSDGCGIAGGALFLNLLLFKNLGGYRKLNSAYNGEDGMLLRDCIQNGTLVGIVKTLSVIHPNPEDDQKYLDWKTESMKSAFENYDENKYKESIKKFVDLNLE
jgi:hypothetical protein